MSKDKKMQIKTICLITGEHIIAKILNVGDGRVTVEDPMQLGISQQGKLMMGPWLMYMDKKVVELKQEHVLYMGKPKDGVFKPYDLEYGSKIASPPEKKLIVP